MLARCDGLFTNDAPPPLREQFEEPLARCGADAALGDEGAHEAGRGHVEGVIGSGAVRRRQADGDAPALLGPAFDMRDLACVTPLDRDRRAALDLPVDRRRGQRYVERDIVVTGGQRLQIGADLVCDVAARRRAVPRASSGRRHCRRRPYAGRRARRAPRR